MDSKDVKILIDTFKEYRDMLNPIQKNLNDFIETYDLMKENIEQLNNSFGGDVNDKLTNIYDNLSSQANKASDLSTRIESFTKMANKYTNEVSKMLDIFSKLEDRIATVYKLESKAEEQIGRLDAIIDEKNKNYNVKELQKSLDSYNTNVQKVSEFINRDVSDSLIQNQKKLESIKDGMDEILKKQRGDNTNLEKLVESYNSSTALLKTIAEKQDVNEAYIFEILDNWAISRRLKIKK